MIIGAIRCFHSCKVMIKNKKRTSAGIPALLSALSHVFRWMRPKDALKLSFKINQQGGFDCPGCAWPDPGDHRSSIGEYCENGMKALAEEATNKHIGAEFFQRHSIDELWQWTDYELGKSGRLTEPLILKPGSRHYAPISWQEAFDWIGGQLNSLPTPDEAIFYTSGRTSNEAAFLYQLFVRAYGTNNMPDCSNMCHESSGVGLSETIGIGKGTVTLEDFYEAGLVVVVGQNPGTNHPRMLSALERCKENGGKIIAINPLPEAGLLHFINPQRPGKLLTGGTPLADLFLPVRINGDVPLLKAIQFLLLRMEKENPGRIVDRPFIKQYTTGFEQWQEVMEQLDFHRCVRESGVEEALIVEAAQYIATHQKMIVCWAMGLTQHKNAVDNIQEIVNLLLLRGSIGIPGAGACPVRGHSNVQGDRTMGIWEAPKPAFLDALKEVFGFDPPRHHGYNTVQAIEAMSEGKAKVFIAMGGNFLSASPDTGHTAEALRQCRLTVHVSTKLNRSHLAAGEVSIILPCIGRTEQDIQHGRAQFVTVENSMGIVHSSQGVLSPASANLLSEPAIVAGMATATLATRALVNWQHLVQDYDRIRYLIEKTIPGFEDYNRRARQPNGFYLPNGPRNRKFTTADGKAHFSVIALPQWDIPEDALLMMTIRTHDQFNTTIYGLNDRYRGVFNERKVVLMNEKDMERKGLKVKQKVELYSNYKGKRRSVQDFLVVPYDIPQGCVATYFPEANALIPADLYAEKSFTPVSKSVVVWVEG